MEGVHKQPRKLCRDGFPNRTSREGTSSETQGGGEVGRDDKRPRRGRGSERKGEGRKIAMFLLSLFSPPPPLRRRFSSRLSLPSAPRSGPGSPRMRKHWGGFYRRGFYPARTKSTSSCLWNFTSGDQAAVNTAGEVVCMQTWATWLEDMGELAGDHGRNYRLP